MANKNLKVSSGLSSKTLGGLLPEVGTILAYAGSTAPAGWLLCNGATFTATTYPELYILLGNSNTLPDLQKKYLRGAATANTAGANVAGGHTHNANYLASNSTNNNSADHNHAHNINYNGVGASTFYHDHYILGTGQAGPYMTNAGNYVVGTQGNMVGTHYHYGYWANYAGNMGQTGVYHGHNIDAVSANASNPSHSHAFDVSTVAAALTTTTELPPTIYLNYIIKAG